MTAPLTITAKVVDISNAHITLQPQSGVGADSADVYHGASGTTGGYLKFANLDPRAAALFTQGATVTITLAP